LTQSMSDSRKVLRYDRAAYESTSSNHFILDFLGFFLLKLAKSNSK
jgi:hypothetical protein